MVLYFKKENTSIAREKIPVLSQLTLLAVILLLLLGGAVVPKIFALLKEKDIQNQTSIAQTNQTNKTDNANHVSKEGDVEPFSNIDIKAKAAYVWDVSKQKALYKKNSDEQLPLASITKLMTALVAQEILSENTTVAISDTAIRQDGDSGLLSGERFNRQKLSDLMLMSSSNDGAYALAASAGKLLDASKPASAFVKAMNIRADELGLHQTYFKNPTGLDISKTKAGAYGSAKDIAFLMEYILTHEASILDATTDLENRIYSDDGFFHDAQNTNYYIKEIPGLLASKTGYTDLAGGNLVIAFDAGLNRPIIISVLGSSYNERFTDVQALVKEVQEYVIQNN